MPGPPPPDDLPAWVAAATRRRLDLHLKAASPVWADREDASARMSALLAEAIEKVRAVDAARRAAAGTG